MEKKLKFGKRYSATLKWQAALEAIKGKEVGQVSKLYGVHPTSVGHWKDHVLKAGPDLFKTATTIKQSEQRIEKLEQLLGKKEVEIAFLKNFLTQAP